ncbi:MAG: DUF1464 family protein [Chloroflexota bacterium]
MRVIGIDPGTGSFDFFGMEDGKIILDTSIAVPDVARNPEVLVDTIRDVLPLDMVVGPSGYGLPVTRISDMGDRELDLMVPDDKSIPLYDGIRMVLRLMKREGLPVCFTPGVIHLSTVPFYRKANRMDMGTADKVCCVAAAVRDEAKHLQIDCRETSFILAEVGFAFTAVMGVEHGSIVDGIGGTSGGPGFITLGNMDSELAVRLGKFPGVVLFSGGAYDMSGRADMTPEILSREHEKYTDAWNMLLEGVTKSVAAMTISVKEPKEILLSGRLTGIPRIFEALKETLSRYGTVRRITGRAKTAKLAAEGAYIIGEGLLGGKYEGIVSALKLNEASGTMYDHIKLRGVTLAKP